MSVFWLFVFATASFLPITVGENAIDSSRKLILVQLLYRHGDRTPINAFPTDPNKDYFKNIGDGQLTPSADMKTWPSVFNHILLLPIYFCKLAKIGKEQHFLLGKYFRARYADFLSARYHVDNVTVRSTDIDRTLMSAYCNLAGLFPPQSDQIWDPNLSWQPIPVHTVPENDDWVLLVDNTCAKYKKLFEEAKHSDEMKKLDEENAELYKNLTEWTGVNVTNIFEVGHIYDVLYIESLYNLSTPEWSKAIIERLRQLSALSFTWYTKDFELQRYSSGRMFIGYVFSESHAVKPQINLYNLSLPKWAESVLPIMNKLKSIKVTTKTSTVTLTRLRGGPLLGELIKNMQHKITGAIPTKQLFVYSAHDTTVSALLSALQLYNGVPPPYTATVILELFKEKDSYIVEVSYKNSTAEPILLQIPGCADSCPVAQFVQLYADIIPKDIKAECKLHDDEVVGNASLTVIILTGCLVVIFVGTLILGSICWRKRRHASYRYNMIQPD